MTLHTTRGDRVLTIQLPQPHRPILGVPDAQGEVHDYALLVEGSEPFRVRLRKLDEHGNPDPKHAGYAIEQKGPGRWVCTCKAWEHCKTPFPTCKHVRAVRAVWLLARWLLEGGSRP